MSTSDVRTWRMPWEQDLGLLRVLNNVGLCSSVLPNGSVFAIEHRTAAGAILVSQVLASPIDGGIARILLRLRAPGSITREVSACPDRLGAAEERITWEGVTRAVHHRVTLRVLPDRTAWLWRVDVTNASEVPVPIDTIFLQDLGLGVRDLVTNNEAYASQYIDHHVANDARFGCPVVMSRQNSAQDGNHPWVMHACLKGAHAFATDAMHLFGPRHRDANGVRLAVWNSPRQSPASA